MGYENPLYFSQVFKNVMNVSPVEYRNTYLKNKRVLVAGKD